MAPKNNLLGDIFSSSPNFLSQLLFGLFLFIISRIANASVPLSLFIAIMGGVTLGRFTLANDSNSEPTTVASNDGIDAGLKYWLFFYDGLLFPRLFSPYEYYIRCDRWSWWRLDYWLVEK
ncbi:hypothetical protein [Aphanizomenon flos-aquae]|uniref:hypothetical protein n=1 Tax=Aphanizomenon flos-aquae TaxID=1176 RepID=UPI000A3EAFE1